jgi:TonB-dependent SusC/RagA subfamily outer membrane receptor
MLAKKISLSLLLIFAFIKADAQTFGELTYRIDSLANIGLAKSALAEVDKLDALARNNKNAPQQVKAAIFRMTFQSYLEENALMPIISRLKADIAHAEYPVKPVLQSILANMYWQYYQQNRWRFNQRTHLDKPSDDITKWDLQTIIEETSNVYRQSLSEATREQHTPIGVLDGVLRGDKNTRNLRPTLYDMLVHRAFEFYLSEESALPKPRMPFTMNDARFFSGASQFVEVQIKTTDTTSTYYKGIKYLQQATAFHLKQGDEEALADIDLKRLTFVHTHARFYNADSLYLKALNDVAREFSAKPVSTDALVLLGQYQQQENDLVKAVSYFDRAVALFPGSLGGKNATILLKQINQKELSVQVEDKNVPGKPLLASCNYRNVKAAFYQIYHLTEKQTKDFSNNYNRYYNTNNSGLLRLFHAVKPIQEKQLNLPGTTDYRDHQTEFKIDALAAGSYVILTRESTLTDSSFLSATEFRVTQIAYNTRATPEDGIQIVVTNRETGAPLKGVKINILESGYNINKKYKDQVDQGKTNNDGLFNLHNFTSGNYEITLTKGLDTLYSKSGYINGSTYDDDQDTVKHTIIFTDRQIYRPGQTIYFKALQTAKFKSESMIMPGEMIDIDLFDANNKIINSFKMVTNDFGTVAGSFNIPLTVLNGDMRLSANDGDIDVKVEDYKRPTFMVKFDPVKESYKPGDSVMIKGNVKAFSGYGLTAARVAYHIVRSRAYSYTYYRSGSNEPDEIKADTINTDGQGRFKINFKALAQQDVTDKSNYIYQVNADVTDASGETHSSETSITIGVNNIKLQAYVPDELFVKDLGELPLSIKNLNNQQQSGTIHAQLYLLQPPVHLYKKRLWAKPDQYLLTREQFSEDFPDYAYKNDNEPAYYLIDKIVADCNIPANDTTNATIDFNVLKSHPTGIYKVILKARNSSGDTITVTNYINFYNEHPRAANFANWVVPVVNLTSPEGKASFLVGINEQCHVLIEQYDGPKLLSAQWVNVRDDQKNISIKLPINVSDNRAVQFMMVYQNRLYTSYQKINIVRPDNKLNIKFLTYRNKLQPGEKEQWKLELSGTEKNAAEMVAGLYDASLDDIAPAQDWTSVLEKKKNEPEYFSWNYYDFVNAVASTPFAYHNVGFPLEYRKYETLDLFGYRYYGGTNYGYRNFLQRIKEHQSVAQRDKQLKDDYLKQAALIRDGYDIMGKVIDAKDGLPIIGVVISVKGSSIGTHTNSDGVFRLKVPVNSTLVLSFIGYNSVEIKTVQRANLTLKLEENAKALQEVVVVGYGSVMKRELTGAVSSVIRLRGNFDQVLAGRVAGVSVYNLNEDILKSGDPGASAQIMIRGLSSISADKAPLYVIDGVLVEDGLKGVNPMDIGNINVLKSTEATALYGARAVNGVIIITTKKAAALQVQQPIAIRKNFNETAFFYPQLHTDEKGQILIDFTIPEALTRWKFRGFAHTQDLKVGYLEAEVVTQKQLSITANTPRFMREGDTLTVSARLSNLSTDELTGNVHLQLFNALNMQPVTLLINAAEATQNFDVKPLTNKSVSFKMAIPAGLEAITYRLTASAGTFSDGEENTIPVLPNRTLVIESMPMMVRAGQTKNFTFDKLINQHSSTLQNKTLTLEYTQNPAWYAVQALPYLMEFSYECSEQIFSRYYANSMASNLVNTMPVIKQVFDRWKATNSSELLSNLEKNQELKQTLLEETPWLKDGINESEQKKRIALLFDLNHMSNELGLNLDKLENKQLADGGFPWFGGDRSDRYITQHIVEGIGQLHHLHIGLNNKQLNEIAAKALTFMDNGLIDDYNKWLSKKINLYSQPIDVQAWYARSFYIDKAIDKELKPVFDAYIKQVTSAWTQMDVYEQGMIALTLSRYNHVDEALKIERSLLERAQQSDDMGMYWSKNQAGYFWYQSPVETQSLMIELFTEVGDNAKQVEEMKIWLLRNKQTNDWKTTKATAAACYALLMRGSDILATGLQQSVIKLNNQDLQQLKPDLKAEAGTGYLKTSWVDEQIKPAMGKVSIANNGKTVSWGALHWQYLENLDKITPSSTDIKLERMYFIVKQTDRGEVLTAIDAHNIPKTGDLLKVVVYLKAGRDYEYVQLKDMRPAGTEPVDALSTYKYQDGLYYYQVTKDVATNFFISYLNKGNYVFEYRLRVAQPGNFSTGISTVQCMYAPEFNAHSEGSRMSIK